MSYNELLAYAALASVTEQQIKRAVEDASVILGWHYEGVASAMMEVLKRDQREVKTRRDHIETAFMGLRGRKY